MTDDGRVFLQLSTDAFYGFHIDLLRHTLMRLWKSRISFGQICSRVCNFLSLDFLLPCVANSDNLCVAGLGAIKVEHEWAAKHHLPVPQGNASDGLAIYTVAAFHQLHCLVGSLSIPMKASREADKYWRPSSVQASTSTTVDASNLIPGLISHIALTLCDKSYSAQLTQRLAVWVEFMSAETSRLSRNGLPSMRIRSIWTNFRRLRRSQSSLVRELIIQSRW